MLPIQLLLALLAGAKYRIGLIKQLLLSVLYLVLMHIKLLGQLRQRLVAFNRCQCRLRFEPRQMVSLLRLLLDSCGDLNYLRNYT